MVTLPPAVTNFEVSNDLNQKGNETNVKKKTVFYNTINSFIINSKKYFSPV